MDESTGLRGPGFARIRDVLTEFRRTLSA